MKFQYFFKRFFEFSSDFWAFCVRMHHLLISFPSQSIPMPNRCKLACELAHQVIMLGFLFLPTHDTRATGRTGKTDEFLSMSLHKETYFECDAEIDP